MKKNVINILEKEEFENNFYFNSWKTKENGTYSNLKNECYIIKEDFRRYFVIDNRKGKLGLNYFDNVLKCFSWLYNKK